jgi:hypothetical protein
MKSSSALGKYYKKHGDTEDEIKEYIHCLQLYTITHRYFENTNQKGTEHRVLAMLFLYLNEGGYVYG